MRYTMLHLEDYIKKIYKRAKIIEPNEPIEIMAEKLGINLLYNNKISLSTDNLIIINKTHSREKQKEIFAHELGHVLHHAGKQIAMRESYRNLQETKANNFSQHFCIPTFMLSKMQIPSDRCEATDLIANTFAVTQSFAEERLRNYERKILQEYQDKLVL